MPRSFRKNVGVLGLGIIGRRIADHLRHQGLAVFVWNRTPRPVPNFVGSPAELAQTCNYLQIFVSDDDALMRMIQVITPSLTSRHIIIAHATVSPDTMREAAALVQRRGARLVEAPFTGSKLAAEKGELVYYVGGEEAALNEVRPLLEASSKAILQIGEIGHASIIKVATNLVTAATVQAAAEGMALVHYSGIPLEKFAEAMKHNGSNSGTLDMKVPAIMSANFEPHFSIKHMLKDMQIASRLGRDFDLDLGLAGATRDRLLDEARQGRGDQDYSSIARKFLPFVESAPVEQQQPDLFSQPEEMMPVEMISPAELTAPAEAPDFLEEQRAQLESAGVSVAQPHRYDEVELPPEPPLALPQVAEAEPPAVVSEAAESLREEPEPVRELTLPPANELSRHSEPLSQIERVTPANVSRIREEKRAGFLSRLFGRTADY